MFFRKATRADIETIAKLARVAANEADNTWDENYPSVAQFEETLGYDGLYVAEEEGEILGSVGIQPAESIFADLPVCSSLHKKPCEVCRLFVIPQSAGKHIAESLLRFALEDAAKENGYDSVHFIAAVSNSRANRLYSRMGFRNVGATNWIDIDWNCYENELPIH